MHGPKLMEGKVDKPILNKETFDRGRKALMHGPRFKKRKVDKSDLNNVPLDKGRMPRDMVLNWGRKG